MNNTDFPFRGNALNTEPFKQQLKNDYICPIINGKDLHEAVDIATGYLIMAVQNSVEPKFVWTDNYTPSNAVIPAAIRGSVQKAINLSCSLSPFPKSPNVLYSVEFDSCNGNEPPHPIVTARTFEPTNLQGIIESSKQNEHLYGLNEVTLIPTAEVIATIGIYVPDDHNSYRIAIPFIMKGKQFPEANEIPGTRIRGFAAPILGLNNATSLAKLFQGKAEYLNPSLAKEQIEQLNRK
jgi:hypothetical protein